MSIIILQLGIDPFSHLINFTFKNEKQKTLPTCVASGGRCRQAFTLEWYECQHVAFESPGLRYQSIGCSPSSLSPVTPIDPVRTHATERGRCAVKLSSPGTQTPATGWPKPGQLAQSEVLG